MRKKLVLFDLDGTLIKSMDLHYLSWKQVLSEFNVKLNKKKYFPLEGMALNLIAKYFLDINKIQYNNKIINNIVQNKKKIFIKKVKNIKLYPGVRDTLCKISKAKMSIGLVTSSHKIQVKKSLPKDILSFFDVIVTGDMVKKNKPHPDPYLFAAKLFRISPNNCIVIENSPLGIISAKKAKMKCIAITNTNDQKTLNKADYFIKRLSQLFNVSYFLNHKRI